MHCASYNCYFTTIIGQEVELQENRLQTRGYVGYLNSGVM